MSDWLAARSQMAMSLAFHIVFAVSAVSGTVLSFELGLLWPTFMQHAGPVVSMPFSLEGFAFFTEAIFLGIYLYAWKRVSAKAHIAAGVVVVVSGALSGAFVVCANAWMNAPTGFTMTNGIVTDVQPMAAMFNAAAPTEVLHVPLTLMLVGVVLAWCWRGVARRGLHVSLIRQSARRRAKPVGFDMLNCESAYARIAGYLHWYGGGHVSHG